MNYRPVIQTTILNRLPIELFPIVDQHLAHLANITKMIFTSEEIKWLFLQYQNVAISTPGISEQRTKWLYMSEGYKRLAIESVRIETMPTHSGWAIGNIRITRPRPKPDELLDIENIDLTNAVLDAGSIFYLLRKRLECLGYARATETARSETLKFLTDIFNCYLVTNPIFLEIHLCATRLCLGLVDDPNRQNRPLTQSVYAQRGGDLEEMRDGITQRCTEHLERIKTCIEEVE